MTVEFFFSLLHCHDSVHRGSFLRLVLNCSYVV